MLLLFADSEGPAGSAWLIGVQPSVHCTINKGQLVFGSQLVENNLVVCFTQAEGQYAVTQVHTQILYYIVIIYYYIIMSRILDFINIHVQAHVQCSSSYLILFH